MSTEKDPQNYIERLIWLHGRKFYLAFFAGASCFVAFVAVAWIAARTSPEKARILTDFAGEYFFYAASMVTVYSGTNAVIERFHAKDAGASARKRQSGTVTTHDEETH